MRKLQRSSIFCFWVALQARPTFPGACMSGMHTVTTGNGLLWLFGCFRS